MRRIDMHIHTYASDGSYTPYQVLKEAKKIGIDFLCISDHDSVESLPEATKLAHENNIGITNAMEATCFYLGKEFHVLGYGFDIDNEKIKQHIVHTAMVNDKLESDILNCAADMSPDKVSIVEYTAYENDRTRGGFKTFNYLKDKGVVGNIGEYMKIKRKFEMASYGYAAFEDIIDMYHDANGLIILAHPSYHYRGSVMDTNILDSFREIGIDGIECISPYNSENEQIKYYNEYCKRYNLAISGGSDCHGPYLTRLMGTPLVTDENTNILNILGL